MSRHALLIGTAKYHDPELCDLPAVSCDLAGLEAVLRERGRFDTVDPLCDPSHQELERSLEDFFGHRRTGDMLLLYFSGHGITDEERSTLFLTGTDTEEKHLLSTAVDADSVLRRLLKGTRASQKLVILDCCFSGAFGAEYRFRGGVRADVERTVHHRGTFVLTASDRLQQARERVDAPGQPSVFTGVLLAGLGGRARDGDRDGWLTAQDVAEYVQDEMSCQDHGQTPCVFNEGVTGPIPVVQVAEAPAVVPSSVPAAGRPGIVEQSIDSPFDGDQWGRLLTYYAGCVEREASLEEFVAVAGRERYAVLPAGPEPVLSQAGGVVPRTAEVTALAGRVAATERPTLAYGYPVVMTRQPRYGGMVPCSAPLLRCEVVADATGLLAVALPARLNRGLLGHLRVSGAETDDLAAFVDAELVPGDARSLRFVAESVLGALGVPALSAVDPERTVGRFRTGRATDHAQNVAVLYESANAGGIQRRLVEDLRGIAKVPGSIPGTALHALATPEVGTGTGSVTIVAPDRLNEAQEQIIASALTSRLTVAQGPPGTGKSQLVRALVTTAAAAGQTVLVASVNNKPVDGVVEPIDRLHPGLIVRTGSREHVDREPDLLNALLTEYADAAPADEDTPAAELRLVQDRVTDLRDVLDRRRELERDLADLARERAGYVTGTGFLPADGDALARLVCRADRAAHHRLLGWWDRRRLCRTHGHLTTSELLTLAHRAATELRWRERHTVLAQLPTADECWLQLRMLTEHRRPGASRALALAQLGRRVRQGARQLERRRDTMRRKDPSSWTGFVKLLPYLPAWATTAHSARNLPPDAGLFDLVVIDEAAQCHIAAVLPLLYRARRALIIGDPAQLAPVITLSAQDEAEQRAAGGIGHGWLEQRRLTYTRHSSYDATATALGCSHLLDEHYRCHPDIIGVPNRRVYQRRLTVLTDPDALAVTDAPAVSWLDVRGSVEEASAGSSGYNDPEARAVAAEAIRLRGEHPTATIGVVTPLLAQQRRIHRLLLQAGETIPCGTVHRFQGDEKDIMILSPVGGDRIKDSTRRWLLAGVNLWNVAITRARSRLVVVGDAAWWSAQDSMLADLQAVGRDPGAGHAGQPRPAADALHAALGAATGLTVRRGVRLAGQVCDLVVIGAARQIAVLVDDPAGDSDGRRLRHLLARRDLVARAARRSDGVRPGPPFADPAVIRVAAWECYADVGSVVARLGAICR